MELPLLSQGKKERCMECGSNFFAALDNPDVVDGDVQATATLTPEQNGTWRLRIDVKGVLTTPCDRCLGPLQIPVNDTFQTIVRPGLPSEMQGDEISVSPEANTIDLTRPIADTILLAIPLRHVHDDGKCDPEMIKALQNRKHNAQTPDNPFGILAEMLGGSDQ